MFTRLVLLAFTVATAFAVDCPKGCTCVCPSTTLKPTTTTSAAPKELPDCGSRASRTQEKAIFKKVLELHPHLNWDCELEDDAKNLRSRYYRVEYPLAGEVRLTDKRSKYTKAVDFVSRAKWDLIKDKATKSERFGCFMNVKPWSNWDLVEIICVFA